MMLMWTHFINVSTLINFPDNKEKNYDKYNKLYIPIAGGVKYRND